MLSPKGCRALNLIGDAVRIQVLHSPRIDHSVVAQTAPPRPPHIQNTMYSVHSKGEICDSRDINSPFRYCHMAIQ